MLFLVTVKAERNAVREIEARFRVRGPGEDVMRLDVVASPTMPTAIAIPRENSAPPLLAYLRFSPAALPFKSSVLVNDLHPEQNAEGFSFTQAIQFLIDRLFHLFQQASFDLLTVRGDPAISLAELLSHPLASARQLFSLSL